MNFSYQSTRSTVPASLYPVPDDTPLTRTNICIVGILDIEKIIISLTHYNDFKNLVRINKYYNNLLTNNILFREYKIFKKNNLKTFDDMLKFNLTNLFLNYYDYSYKQQYFSIACLCDNLKVAKKLYSRNFRNNHKKIHINYENSTFFDECLVCLFYKVCERNKLNVAKWLFLLLKNNDICHIYDIYHNLFKNICLKNYFKMAEWLHEIFYSNKSVINTTTNGELNCEHQKIFNMACSNGNLEIAKLLYKLTVIDLNYDSDSIFIIACKNGHLQIVEWLYKLIDITVDEINVAFRTACGSGCLKIAQWLYTLGNVNINANNEAAFDYAFMNKHFEVALWLYNCGNVNLYNTNYYAKAWKNYKIKLNGNNTSVF